jgi:hypothetical protein
MLDPPHCLHWLLTRLCSQMPEPLHAPPHCLRTIMMRLCSQRLEPPNYLHSLLSRLRSQMLEPPHCLRSLLWRLCSQMLDPPHCLLTRATASLAVVLTDARPGAPTRSSGLFSGIPVLVNTLFTQDSKHTKAPEASEYVRMYCDSVYECAQTRTTHTYTLTHILHVNILTHM